MSTQGSLFPAHLPDIADQEARAAALDPRRSFIVQAPAGSGKTDLLVRRYLGLLKTVKQPEEVLAITFTIKSAAEMRKRVLESIVSSGLNPAEIGPRLRVQTIDAFCGSLVRRMPVMSAFGAQPEIVEDAREHYQEAAYLVLKNLFPPVERLLQHLDNNVEAATDLIASMLARRDQWLRKTGAAPTRAELERNLSLERRRLIDAARALHPKASPEFADAMLTKAGTWFKNNPEAQSLSDNEPLRLALLTMRRLPPERYTESQWETLGAMLQLLPLAAAQLKVVFAERGECDFTEIAQGAVRALGTPDEPTDLLLSLDYRIKHILVDEFQDTSWSQWELLERLTAGWQKADGRTLFLVGDPMQSIYRFREAEVALFLKAQREGLGGVTLQRLTLSTNFRSQAGLVGFYNGAFPQIFPAQADESSGAVPYSSATAHPGRKAQPDPVVWHAMPDRRSEAARVIELLKGPQGRTAILVRNRASLDDIVPALRKAGIRYRAIEIEQLGQRQVVQDLYALTRALTHLGDRVAWLSLLRAPWCGRSLNELHSIAGNDRFATIWELIQSAPSLERFRSILGPAIANRGRGTLRDLVEGVWLALGGPACVESRTDLEDAEIFLDALDNLEGAGGLDFSALAAALERLFALPDVAAGDDDLQIMTIHKAKGLEFDTVIVPGLDKGPGKGDPPLFLWKELVDGGGLLLAPIKETGAEKDAAYSYLARLDTVAEDMESSRLLYVAATRAKRKLHLLACVECDEHGETKKPRARSLLEKSWPVAEPHLAAIEAAVPGPEAAVQAATFRRLATTSAAAAPAARWTPPPEGRIEERVEFSWASETAKHVGTVVHRWLQRIAEEEMRGWDAARVLSLEARFSVQLECLGVPRAELKESAARVAGALKNTLADERGRWLLGPRAEAKAEYRLRTAGGATYVIDRCFRDADGAFWVVDWKTGQHQGRDLEAFLASEQERHAPQLERYAAALGATRLGLYFPALARWREWKK
jgi:ATP-dependent helicase/nuclease subunit A